ncbi:MAG: response regulator [Anaerolineales bacterium]|nr:response regulator [Anaerolineales bacterium]
MPVTGYILVVDDIPDILKLLETTLTFKGYRVVTARNGQEALDAIRNERPALVIADILMPKMDGFSLVHRLRINPKTRDIPVVFLSATYVAPEDKDFALAIGVTRFIEKPVDIEAFLPVVSDILAQKIKPAHQAIGDFEFYDGYRKRLETKLQHKNAQITRSERLLNTSQDAEEKLTVAQSLESARLERDEILNLLEQIRKQLDDSEKPE